jgi:hypothetical protein
MWLIFLGVMFILVTIFMPKGIVGLPAQLRAFYKKITAKKTVVETSVATEVDEIQPAKPE